MQSRILQKRRVTDKEQALPTRPLTTTVNPSEVSANSDKLSEQAESTKHSLKNESSSLENSNTISVDNTSVLKDSQETEPEQVISTQVLDNLLAADKIHQKSTFTSHRYLILSEAGYVLAVGLNSLADRSATFLSYSTEKTIPNEKNYTHAYVVFNGKDIKTEQPIQLVIMRPFAQAETWHTRFKQWVTTNTIRKYFQEKNIELDLKDYCFSGECKSLLTIEQVLQMIDQPLGKGITFNTKGTQTNAFKPIAKLKELTNSDEIKLRELVQRWHGGEKPSLPRILTYIPKRNFDLDKEEWDLGLKLNSPQYRRKDSFFSSGEQTTKVKNEQDTHEQEDKSNDNNESQDQDREFNSNNSKLS
ncbi:Uncharacterised protein [Legionella beliardensis]|uniref:Uncharacterized protein n=1 Tax=Legionella beliardensis TaxID=91822 RepID=A0A378I3D8_9GAMM|nr:hypothetical protein [Legionella beliardensis]STX29513.1 Uncharacterised protein [Legionella beliardensis]